VTIASVLDPAHTGATMMSGVAGFPPIAQLSTSQASSQTGSNVYLQYQSNASSVCTATGGTPGDGWSGILNAYPGGNTPVTEYQAGVLTYGITCTGGGRSTSAQVTVTWSLAPPALIFQVFAYDLFAGAAVPFVWSSNQTSCVATGGSAGDGWGGALPGSGQVNVTESQPGSYDYTLTCGSGSQAISQTLTFNFAAPTASLSLYAPPGLRFGEKIDLEWSGRGGCTASGGGAGDGWAGPVAESGFLFPSEQTAGTYTYTISCGPAAIAAVAHATYTFSNAAPSATLTAAQPTQAIDLSVPTYPTLLTWSSNVQSCNLNYSGPVSGTLFTGYPTQGTDTQPQQIAGLYTYVLTCGYGATLATSTATITWTQQPVPKVTLKAVGNEFPLSSGGYLQWSTNVLPCIGSGGTNGDFWNGTLPYFGGPGNSSNDLVKEPTAGTYLFTITCGVGNVATAQASAIYNNDGGNVLTLTPGGVQVATGQPIDVTWNSAIGPCVGYGGSATDGWNGSHLQQGSATVIETVGGNYTLSLVCGVGAQAVEAQIQIYAAPPTDISIYFAPNNYFSSVGQAVTLGWNGYQAASCTATGGTPGDGWTGTLPYSGSMMVTESQIGSVTYGLTCQNGALSAQASVTVKWSAAPPAVTLSSSTLQATLGTPFTLTWSSTNATNCSASEDGNANGAWTGSLSDAGSASVQETTGTSHIYTISCSSINGNIQAQVTVNFTAATSGGGSGSGSSGSSSGNSSGSSHGGGDLDPVTLGMLAILAATRLRRRSSR
jgi:hypothetical protein